MLKAIKKRLRALEQKVRAKLLSWPDDGDGFFASERSVDEVFLHVNDYKYVFHGMFPPFRDEEPQDHERIITRSG